METVPKQHNMILIVFGGALLAAITVALIIYFLPFINQTDSIVQNTNQQVQLGTTAPMQFNTSILERSEYKELDASLFTRGLLPVVPPTGTGKTNLFR